MRRVDALVCACGACAREARGRVRACGRVNVCARERVTERGRAGLRVGARGRVAGEPKAFGGAWARVWRARNFWRRVGARAGPDPADFGLNGQIVMRSIQ